MFGKWPFTVPTARTPPARSLYQISVFFAIEVSAAGKLPPPRAILYTERKKRRRRRKGLSAAVRGEITHAREAGRTREVETT